MFSFILNHPINYVEKSDGAPSALLLPPVTLLPPRCSVISGRAALAKSLSIPYTCPGSSVSRVTSAQIFPYTDLGNWVNVNFQF